MRILDRYITKSILLIFCCAVLVFSFLFVLIDSASNLDEFIDRQVPFEILLKYYFFYLPVIIVQTAPIACLIATLFTFTNLNNHNEVIALRSSGMSFWAISKSALCFSLIIAALIFLANERYVPHAERITREIKNENMILEEDRKRKKMGKIKNLTFYGLKNRLYFIDSFDPNTSELEGVTIIGYDNHQNIKEKISALTGKWTGIRAWKFYQCQITSYSESINDIIVKVYPEKLIDIEETPQDFLKQRLNVNSMNIKQLYEYIIRFSNSGAIRALNNLKVDLYQKIAFPFATLVIVLVGLPLSLMTGRRRAATFTSLGIAIMIGFLYYVCDAVGLAMGKGGLFPPLLAAWLAPMIFSGIAYYLIKVKF